MSNTDTNQASELYELCKEVYERTKWGQYGDEGLSYFNEELNVARKDMPPLYTSDYLLAKLPPFIRRKTGNMEYGIKFAFKLRMSTKNSGNWRAGYYNSPSKQHLKRLNVQTDADTPLKALLKLTIALSEAGELDNDQSI